MHDGTTPLILAARLAVEGMVEELINCHADVNAIDDFGRAHISMLNLYGLHGLIVFFQSELEVKHIQSMN